MQDAVQKDRKNNVTFERVYDLKLFMEIAAESGNKTLADETDYLRTAKFYGKKKFVSEIINGGAGFYAGVIAKKHFRLIEIAVRESEQGKGYGKEMMWRIIRQCRKRGIEKITLRINRVESAAGFYKRFGGVITGNNGEDYEMEIRICFTSS